MEELKMTDGCLFIERVRSAGLHERFVDFAKYRLITTTTLEVLVSNRQQQQQQQQQHHEQHICRESVAYWLMTCM